MCQVGTFAHLLTLELLGNRPLLRRAIRDALDAGKSVFDALRPAARIRARHDLGEDIEFTLDLARAEEDPAKALDTALRLAQKMAERDKRRVVVFFDEFQDVGTGRFGDGDTITRKMRAVFQRSLEVSVLFAGSIEHLMRNLFAPGERALSQFGSFHELTAITSEEWREGIRDRLARDQTSITSDALRDSLSLARGTREPRC